MKLGVIGTGKIVEEALYAMTPVKEIRKNAIFARPHSREKAEAFGRQYGIGEVYTDYEELLRKADVDTVYIGLVNSVHYEYAKKALECGKNVILEKPFVLSSRQAEDLRTGAEKNGCMIAEAITVLHNPVFDKMKENLPKLGAVKLVLCNYSQYSSRYDDYLKGKAAPAFDPALQGGAVYDLDVYNIHWCAGLFGMPESAQYYPNRGFNGADTSGALVMTYPGFVCVCTAAKDSDSPCFVSVQGEKGWMKIDGKPNAAAEVICSIADSSGVTHKDASGARVRAMSREVYTAPEAYHRMTREFADFAAMMDSGDFRKAGDLLEETISVVRVLESVHGINI